MAKRRISFKQRWIKKMQEEWSLQDLAERLRMGYLFFKDLDILDSKASMLKNKEMALRVIDNLIVYLEFSRDQILKG